MKKHRQIIINVMLVVLVLLSIILVRLSKIKDCKDKGNSFLPCIFVTLKGSSD